MASTTTRSPSLPSKKRKASYGSSSGGEGPETTTTTSNCASASATTTTAITTRLRKDSEHDASIASSSVATKGHQHYIADNRLPSKKRKGSYDSGERRRRFNSHDLSVSFEDMSRKGSIDSSFLLEPLPRKLSNDAASKSDDAFFNVPDSHSPGDARIPNDETVTAESQLTTALEHLDALANDTSTKQEPTFAAAAGFIQGEQPASRKGSDAEDTSSYASSGQRLLFEAIMMSNADDQSRERERADSWGGSRPRLESWDVRERSESWGALRIGEMGRERLESWGGLRGGRDRLESWGGMSDLSVALGPLDTSCSASTAAQIAVTATAIHFQEDLPPIEMEDSKPSAIPSKISLNNRDRFNSIASFSELSATHLPMILDGLDVPGDLQAYVAAAMATVGDQIADLASAVENAVCAAVDLSGDEASSVASPLIGASTDSRRNRPRSWSTSSGMISVDFDAVQAAMNAADLATANGALDLAALGYENHSSGADSTTSSNMQSSSTRPKRRLPTKRARSESILSSASEDVGGVISKQEMQRIRERARLAAGLVPSLRKTPPPPPPPPPPAAPVAPVKEKKTPRASAKKQHLPPIKKRARRNAPPPESESSSTVSFVHTPKASNSKVACKPPPDTPLVPSDSGPEPDALPSASSRTPRGQASQKWESMFECLMEFIQERREEDCLNLPEEEREKWIWDGNVPTNYKTSSGKALGRWVNNQRSAKSKGTLKDDREQRLVDSGLRWSVLTAGSWEHMLEELKIYVKTQTQDGRKWDGNVPTTYQIKTRDNSPFAGEDKNLGRWVNRQRSVFQAGKLRKERRLALEAIGLKWSMLATMSWDAMFDTLEEYVQQQMKEHGKWDGNVPANYKTDHNPPRSLGRWINRQRSSYIKNKIKKEYVDKLNALGLKWSIHQRPDDNEGDETGLSGTTKTKKSSSKNAGSKETVNLCETAGATDTDEKPTSDLGEKGNLPTGDEILSSEVNKDTARKASSDPVQNDIAIPVEVAAATLDTLVSLVPEKKGGSVAAEGKGSSVPDEEKGGSISPEKGACVAIDEKGVCIALEEKAAPVALAEKAADVTLEEYDAPVASEADVAAEQKGVDVVTEENGANVAAEADVAAEQNAVDVVTQEKGANVAAEQKAVDVVTQENGANVAAEEKAASVAAGDAEVAAEEKDADVVAEEKDADVVTGVKDAEVATEEKGADFATEEKGADVAAEQEGTDVAAEQKGTDVPAEQKGTDVPAEQKGTDVPAELKDTDVPAELKGTDVPAELKGTDVPAELKGTHVPAELKDTDIPAELKDTDISAAEQKGASVASEQNDASAAEETVSDERAPPLSLDANTQEDVFKNESG